MRMREGSHRYCESPAALKDALASGGDISSDNLLEDFRNTSLQEDEDEKLLRI